MKRTFISIVFLSMAFILGFGCVGPSYYPPPPDDAAMAMKTAKDFFYMRLLDVLKEDVFSYPMVAEGLRAEIVQNAREVGSAFQQAYPDYRQFQLDANGVGYNPAYLEGSYAIIQAVGDIIYLNNGNVVEAMEESMYIGLQKFGWEWVVVSVADEYDYVYRTFGL